MDIHIGDFWQNKFNPKAIYRVAHFSFRMGGFQSGKDMLLICEEFRYTKIGENPASVKEDSRFFSHITVDNFKKMNQCILSAERIMKDTQAFKTDKDILDYLTKKVEEKLNAK
jgi:hypothetical protein|nr:MAG TPA: hypothetical protein [Caudoviricetes sp.]